LLLQKSMELGLYVRRTARRRQDLQQLAQIANRDSGGHMGMHTINLIATPVCGRCYTLPCLHQTVLAEVRTPFRFFTDQLATTGQDPAAEPSLNQGIGTPLLLGPRQLNGL